LIGGPAMAGPFNDNRHKMAKVMVGNYEPS